VTGYFGEIGRSPGGKVRPKGYYGCTQIMMNPTSPKRRDDRRWPMAEMHFHHDRSIESADNATLLYSIECRARRRTPWFPGGYAPIETLDPAIKSSSRPPRFHHYITVPPRAAASRTGHSASRFTRVPHP